MSCDEYPRSRRNAGMGFLFLLVGLADPCLFMSGVSIVSKCLCLFVFIKTSLPIFCAYHFVIKFIEAAPKSICSISLVSLWCCGPVFPWLRVDTCSRFTLYGSNIGILSCFILIFSTTCFLSCPAQFIPQKLQPLSFKIPG